MGLSTYKCTVLFSFCLEAGKNLQILFLAVNICGADWRIKNLAAIMLTEHYISTPNPSYAMVALHKRDKEKKKL